MMVRIHLAYVAVSAADSVNHLLLVGFYLMSVGFACLALRYGDKPTELVGGN